MSNGNNKPAANVKAPAAKRSLTVQTGRFTTDGKFQHNTGFSGERNGLGFRDGTCTTEDAIRAHACLELGYRVLDAKTGEDAFSKDDPKKPDVDEAAGA